MERGIAGDGRTDTVPSRARSARDGDGQRRRVLAGVIGEVAE